MVTLQFKTLLHLFIMFCVYIFFTIDIYILAYISFIVCTQLLAVYTSKSFTSCLYTLKSTTLVLLSIN